MSFSPESVVPLQLPSLPLSWRKGFPSCSAIYFAISNNQVLYIGRTLNLVRRWANHHRQAELENVDEVRIAWMEVSEPELLPAIEKALIQFFKPCLNHCNIKVRKPKGKPGRKGGNPETYFKTDCPEELAKKMVGVKLPLQVDAYVRSLPNKAAWLRRVITDAYERDIQQQQEDCA